MPKSISCYNIACKKELKQFWDASGVVGLGALQDRSEEVPQERERSPRRREEKSEGDKKGLRHSLSRLGFP